MVARLAVYAGSFDPPTVGHLWMIRQGACIFDRLHVALGVNPEKRALFTVEERLEMLREITQDLPNVSVHSFANQFLVRYAESVGARFVVRGIRSTADFEYERAMRNINGDHAPEVTSVFLVPPRDIAEVSSSFVKGLVGPDGWEKLVKQYVAAPVFERIVRRRHASAEF
jgi:pantetheine-phosphate adenylyltransferase